MKEPSAKRKRTLDLHERALRFSTNVIDCCPSHFKNAASSKVWENLAKAADSTSNNLIEADAASSDADFLSKMGIALREAKESRAGLMKVRVARLDNFRRTIDLELESEASQLSAIFATIILNMRMRLDEENRRKKSDRKPGSGRNSNSNSNSDSNSDSNSNSNSNSDSDSNST